MLCLINMEKNIFRFISMYSGGRRYFNINANSALLQVEVLYLKCYFIIWLFRLLSDKIIKWKLSFEI